MFIVYVERQQVDNYKCIDKIRTVNLEKTFEIGDLLYGYYDCFNIISIDKDMIVSIDGKLGEYSKRHGSYTETKDRRDKMITSEAEIKRIVEDNWDTAVSTEINSDYVLSCIKFIESLLLTASEKEIIIRQFLNDDITISGLMDFIPVSPKFI